MSWRIICGIGDVDVVDNVVDDNVVVDDDVVDDDDNDNNDVCSDLSVYGTLWSYGSS